jgi:hypothetical protein
MSAWIDTIFAPTCDICEILKPLHGSSDECMAAPYFWDILPQRWTVQKALDELNAAAFDNLPASLRSALTEIAEVFRFDNCISIGDVCLRVANSGLKDMAKRGWAAAITAAKSCESQYSWAGRAEELHAATENRRSLIGSQPSPQKFFVAELCKMTGLGNSTLNHYAKSAGIKTPKRGGCNHRYTLSETCRILEWIISENGSDEIRDQCRTKLAELRQIAE